MKRLQSFTFLSFLFTVISCSEQPTHELNEESNVFLSDTLFSHFENKCKLDSSLQLQLARYNTDGDLEWIILTQSDDEIHASYSLNKNYERFESTVWNIFNVTRFQGFKMDSIVIQNGDEKLISQAILELERNPAQVSEPCYDCRSGTLSQVLLSDSSVIIQGNELMEWSSFDTLINKIIN